MSKLNRDKNRKSESESRQKSKISDSHKPVKKHKAKLKPEKIKYRNFKKWIEDDDIDNSIFQEE